MEGKQVQILICDDSMLVRKKLREILENLGCEVTEAQNGKECVEAYSSNRPDAVFMDVIMPILDGLSALKQIKEIDPSARVIMLSSSGTASHLKEALKSGADDFIQKPYNKDQIVRIIDGLSR